MNTSKKIVIVVQARFTSSRLPGKVLLPILGETLLFRIIERLKKVKYTIQIVIATSTETTDDVIENEAQYIGIPCYRGSLNNLLDRHYQVGKLYAADIVLKIPSDCPLIDPSIVDDTLDFYFKNNYHYVSNLHPATFPDGNDVEIMSFDCLQKVWQEATRQLELEHTTPYIWENPEKFKIGNVVWQNGKDYSMSHRFTIDYIEDYEFIKRIFEELYPQNPSFTLNDILFLLTQKPEIYAINMHYAGVNWYRHHLEDLKTVSVEQTKVI
jgi:spore coat polysaccharide biosynthesis protein SpsF